MQTNKQKNYNRGQYNQVFFKKKKTFKKIFIYFFATINEIIILVQHAARLRHLQNIIIFYLFIHL